jgi:two-component system cell cycle response regulator
MAEPIVQRKVLVIDDSPACRAIVCAMLRSHGWLTVEAGDGETGAELAVSTSFDAIVCDHHMNGITGTQLCRLLSADERTSKTPVVVLTATSTRRGLFWAIESGASAYLAKSRSGGRSVAARLGHLLDATLFESVLRGRVRGIAALESTMGGAFRRVASLLGSILEFRWCAIALRGHRDQVWMMHSGSDAEAEREATLGLGAGRDALVERVEEEQCAPRSARERVEVRAIEFGEETIGSIAIAAADQSLSSADAAVLDWVAAELPAVLQLTLLLEQTTKHAMSDELTGIANRRAARDFLERSVVSARRNAHEVSVAMLDIDHFKRVNDGFGHDVGDVVLRKVAATLAAAVRRSDLVARWGGEEFLLVFPQTGEEGARLVCERIRARIEGLGLSQVRVGLSVSASMGVAMLGDDGPDGVLRRADEALYRAKQSGRNRVIVDSERYSKSA